MCLHIGFSDPDPRSQVRRGTPLSVPASASSREQADHRGDVLPCLCIHHASAAASRVSQSVTRSGACFRVSGCLDVLSRFFFPLPFALSEGCLHGDRKLCTCHCGGGGRARGSRYGLCARRNGQTLPRPCPAMTSGRAIDR
jgi:hypothetical protein